MNIHVHIHVFTYAGVSATVLKLTKTDGMINAYIHVCIRTYVLDYDFQYHRWAPYTYIYVYAYTWEFFYVIVPHKLIYVCVYLSLL
jgi:hypothetical protein